MMNNKRKTNQKNDHAKTRKMSVKIFAVVMALAMILTLPVSQTAIFAEETVGIEQASEQDANVSIADQEVTSPAPEEAAASVQEIPEEPTVISQPSEEPTTSDVQETTANTEESGNKEEAEQTTAAPSDDAKQEVQDKKDDSSDNKAEAQDKKDAASDKKDVKDQKNNEKQVDPYKDLLTLEKLCGLPDAEVEATIQPCNEENAKKANRDWLANIYYLNQEQSHDLTVTDNFSLKYQLEFRSSKDKAPFSVEIRVPLSLVKYGEGDKSREVPPSEIGVPQGSYNKETGKYAEIESPKTDFNYYIDTDNQELVFYNYRKISACTVNAWQVYYKDIDASKVEADYRWSFVPEINVQKEKTIEHLEKGELRNVTGNVTYVLNDNSSFADEAVNDDILTVDELKAADENKAEATEYSDKKDDKLSLNEASDRDWSFDIYYVKQNDPYHVEKTDNFNLKYQMEFHNSVDIDPFDVQIRIPISLVQYGHGSETRTSILPNEIAVPQGSYDGENYTWTEARKSAFNYYVDRENNELVFFNYKKIDALSDNAWQILYGTFDVMQIEDEFTWEITPSVEVKVLKEVEGEDGSTTIEKVTQTCDEGELTPLSGRVNTRVELQTVSKRIYSNGKNYTPGLYTKKQVSSYAPNADTVKIPGTNELLYDHFNEYVYVVWEVKVKGYANQPYNIIIQDTTTQSDRYDNPTGFIVGFGNLTNITPGEPYNVGQYNAAVYSKERIFSQAYYVVTAYPRADIISNQTIVNNFLNVTMIPYDGKDHTQYGYGNAAWTYVDYHWRYRGDIIGVNKTGSPVDNNSWTTVYGIIDKEKDLKTSDFSVDGTCRSFALTHYIDGPKAGEYIPGTYAKVTTVDDFVYAYPLSGAAAGTPYRLSKEDYYFNSVKINIRDNGYDVYEDEPGTTLPVSQTEGIDRGLHVYAMFALDETGNPISSDEWEEVGTAEWNSSGSATYIFTAAQIAREPWRVKVEHNSVDYVTYSTISTNISIKGDSPVFRAFPEGTDSIKLENIGGIMGEYFVDGNSHGFFQDTKIEGKYDESHNPGLIYGTGNLYGTILMRDNAFCNLLAEKLYAHSTKSGKAYNDVEHGRAKIRYRMDATEGYLLYDREAIDYITAAGVATPHRSEVVFYDLLPFGVQFDPSGTITAGRIKSEGKPESSWDKKQVEVNVDPSKDIIPNYHGTGRTMVVLHVKYTGRDSSQYGDGYWFSGFGVAFDAYCDYEDYTIASERPNIVAYMPATEDDKPILGADTEVSYDNGRVVSSDGFANYYRELGMDINDDGRTDTFNVLYAQSQVFTDIAISAYSAVEKYVRADDDPFGTYKKSTTVLPGGGYEYKVSLTNASRYPRRDIVFFDHLENSVVDRWIQEPGKFEPDSWTGTFNGLILSELTARGAVPVVYYNASRDAKFSSGSEDPHNVLTKENGWILASEWSSDLADVKSIAVDVSGNNFELEQNDSISIRIRMKAPNEVPEGVTWAYNNPASYSLDTGTNTKQTLAGNSVKVKLVEAKSLEIEKQFAENTPAKFQQEEFRFTLCWNDGTSRYPYAYKEYTMLQKDKSGEWVELAGLYATDADGTIYLKKNQKVRFDALDAEFIEIKEDDSIRWTLTDPTLEGTIENGVRKVTAVNEYHPVLYVTKKVKGYSSNDLENVNLTEFKMKLTDANDNAVSNKNIYVVNQAYTDGREPSVVNAINKLYGNLTVPEKIPQGTRILKTNSEGVFSIYPDEIVAIPLDNANVQYTVTELEECYSPDSDWICKDPDITKLLPQDGALFTIENQSRYKLLYITKKIENSGTADLAEDTFTFKIYEANSDDPDDKGSQIKNFEWQIVDSEGTTSDTWNEPGSDGEITAECIGKVIRVSRFKAESEIIVEEVLSGENADKYEAEEGSIYLKMPVYASAARADFVNNYLYRDLEVDKTAITEDINADLTQKAFTMILETNLKGANENGFEPAVGKAYTIYNKETGEKIEDGVTGNDGSFTIYGNTVARFPSFAKEKNGWRVKEKADDEYRPVLPELNENGPYEEIPDPDDSAKTIKKYLYTEYISGITKESNQARFINGKDGILIIKKKWIPEDEVAEEYLKDHPGINISIYTDFDNIPVEVIDGYQVNYSTTWNADLNTYTLYNNGYIYFNSNDSYIILKKAGNPQEENDKSFANADFSFTEYCSNIWPSSSEPKYYGKRFYVNNNQYRQTIDCTPSEMPVVEFENHLDTIESVVEKRVIGSDVPAGSELVWRVEQYHNGEWVPAANVKYYVSSSAYSIPLYGASGYVPTWAPFKFYDDVTDKDGLIRLTAVADFLATGSVKTARGTIAVGSRAFVSFSEKVGVDLVSANEGDYRVVELLDQSDPEWGCLDSYITYVNENFYPEYRSSQYANRFGTAKGFINSNKKATITVEKVVDEPTDQVFSFILEQYTDVFSDDDLIPGALLDYTVYDRETGDVVRYGKTTSAGKFTLQGGQYAVIEVPTKTRWKVTEEESLPYYVKAIEADGILAENSGNSANISLIGNIDNLRHSNMIKANLPSSLANLLSNYSSNTYTGVQIPQDGTSTWQTLNINNIYFGKASDYPEFDSSAAFEPMDTEGIGSIRGYAKWNDTASSYDVYILSDDLMYTNYNSNYMFGGLYNLKNVYFANVDSSKTTSMFRMFGKDVNLKGIYGTELLDTSNVRDMSYMFFECNSLGDYDARWIKTDSVVNMEAMFANCLWLKSVNAAGWKTSNVKNMKGMFAAFNGSFYTPYNQEPLERTMLTSVDVSGWDTSNVEDMSYMFAYNNYLTSVDVGNWNTEKVKDMQYMFTGCNSINGLKVSGWNTSNVENMNSMFAMNTYYYGSSEKSSELDTLDVSGWDTSKVKDMAYMFMGCDNISTLDVSGWKTDNVTQMQEMFAYCRKLNAVNAKGWNTSSVTNMYEMFYECDSLESLDLSDWDVSNTVSLLNSYTYYNDIYYYYGANDGIKSMFYGCNNLKTLILKNWDLSNTGCLDRIFSGCASLEVVDLSGWNTSGITSANGVFDGCSSLKGVDLSGWDTSRITTISSFFSGCSSLESVDLNSWDTSALKEAGNVFQNCASLKTAAIDKWNVSKVTSFQSMFNGCSSLESININSWKPDSIKNLSYMFLDCSTIEEIDLSNWTTENVTGFTSMFKNCTNLKTLDIEKFTIPLITYYGNINHIFYNCPNLTAIYCNNDWYKYISTYSGSYIFYNCNGLPSPTGWLYYASPGRNFTAKN